MGILMSFPGLPLLRRQGLQVIIHDPEHDVEQVRMAHREGFIFMGEDLLHQLKRSVRQPLLQ